MPFSPEFLKTLERLVLLARRRTTRGEPGDRPSSVHGSSIEFADHRPYSAGDEVRYIDWNVYARHGSLFVKEFTAEENLHLVLLLDVSGSMRFGSPPKFEAARELAAALGYVGLASCDAVSLYAFRSRLEEHRRFLRGKAQVHDLLAALDGLDPSGMTDLRPVLEPSLPAWKGRSICALLTDGYDPGAADALRRFRARGRELRVVHLVAREEMEPTVTGPYRLVDLETGARREIHVTPDRLERYRRRFARHCDDLEQSCLSMEYRYVRVRSDAPLEERVMQILGRGGILELR